MPKQLHNGHELWREMGGPTVAISGVYSIEFTFWKSLAAYNARKPYLKVESADPNVFRTWDDLVKKTGITRWARSNGQYAGVWAPVASFEKVAGQVEWRRSVRVEVEENGKTFKRWADAPKGTKLTWVEGRPCAIHGCDQVGIIEREYQHARRNFLGDQPAQVGLVCKRHNSLGVRADARQAESDERSRLRKEESDRIKQAEQAAAEMAQRVVGALQSLDVARAELLVGTDGDGRVTLTIDAADALLKAVEFTLEMEGL